ncbi:hypothetical protein BMETH_246_2 [methanotrophic bacterial endosymbiont of Bathymodiolus sp.]|nr:hypothetical protein BMETH_246_2 [methanotrophic bacterial endosymbiont of Bathymodiolus sp.]
MFVERGFSPLISDKGGLKPRPTMVFILLLSVIVY